MSTPLDSSTNRIPTWVWALMYVLLLAFLVPPFLRTPLDCDPQLFDLFVRDAKQGALLYRDMVENKTPAMYGIHFAIRSTLGWSSEAIRAVDLCVVGLGIVGLTCWFPRSRQALRWILLIVLTTFYLTLSEWCHVQCDVWLLTPIMAALHVRRRFPVGSMGARLFEGLLWGLAVAMKPHVIVVAFAVWLVGCRFARTEAGTSWGGLIVDTFATALGGATVLFLGLFAMDRYDLLQPYYLHMTGWAGDYAKANFYGPFGAMAFRIQFAVRLMPWSLVYAIALLLSAVGLLRFWISRRAQDMTWLQAALIGWTIQAFAVQHVFDYPHIAPIMISIAVLLRRFDDREVLLVGAVLLLAGLVAFKEPYFTERAKLWKDCFEPQVTPAFRDRLAQMEFVSWDEMAPVAAYVRQQGYLDGDVIVASDSALPFWQLSELRPPTRYYLFLNNLLAFPSKRTLILDAVTTLPHLKVVVCDVTKLRWTPRTTTAPHDLPDDWHGPAHWADRVVFRSGRYALVAMNANEFPQWLIDVTDWEK
ncbi:MAG: hypothetical protein U0798_20555 [Gemmataceae bacterium]